MNIRLKPELEKLVAQDVQRGPYQTVDEFVERAVVLLHEHETWLAEHAAEVREKIGEGFASAKRGDLIDADQVRTSLGEKKRAWLASQRKA